MFKGKSSVDDEIDGACFRRSGPLKAEIAGLEQRLQQERKRQVKLRASYDKACVAADTAPETYLSPHVVRHMNYRRRRLKTEYETVSGLIAGLETTLAEKVSQLQQPVESRSRSNER